MLFNAKKTAFFALALMTGAANAFTGAATFYNPGAGVGACGQQIAANSVVVALPVSQYGGGSHCGKNINVQFNGKSIQAKVVDECVACNGNGIDLSTAAFSALAPLSTGLIQVSWNFV